MLARHFVEKFCRDMTKPALLLSPAALDELRNYPWPGNVRELQNCIERAVILCEGDTIQPRHLNLSFRDTAETPPSQPVPAAAAAPPPAANGHPLAHIDLSGTMMEAVKRVTAVVERVKLEAALKNAKGNKERAAEALQVSYKALLHKQREHGLVDS
jgi:DNA-binding NtrC family response regulator